MILREYLLAEVCTSTIPDTESIHVAYTFPAKRLEISIRGRIVPSYLTIEPVDLSHCHDLVLGTLIAKCGEQNGTTINHDIGETLLKMSLIQNVIEVGASLYETGFDNIDKLTRK